MHLNYVVVSVFAGVRPWIIIFKKKENAGLIRGKTRTSMISIWERRKSQSMARLGKQISVTKLVKFFHRVCKRRSRASKFTGLVWPRVICGELTATGFVAVITAIVVVIAFQFRVDAFLPIGAFELVQRTWYTLRRRTQLFVPFITAIVITIAFLLYWYTYRVVGRVFFASEVAVLARSVD